MSQRPPKNGPDWDATVSQASDHIDEGDRELSEAAARQERDGRGPVFYLLVSVPVLLAVIAWNVWTFTRPPEVPPDAEIAFALRQNAAALAKEVFALRAEQGRLPTPGELGAELDDELRYELRGESFVITNTDGVLAVRYDGSRPVDDWVASGGYSTVEGVR